MIANRDLTTIFGAAFQTRHYRAAANMLRTYDRPLQAFGRYLTGRGQYPCTIKMRTRSGSVEPTLYSHHDLLTVNEIFCRRDYACPRDAKVVVDFGSNIGISGLFFLTECHGAFTYLFEPLPINCDRLTGNLAPYRGRFCLHRHAVGVSDGEVMFGYEPSGRYGGVGRPLANTMTVQCRQSNAVLDEILDRHGFIDVLKVDIETMERDIIINLGTRANSIGLVLVEQSFSVNPLSSTHSYRQYGPIARFTIT